MAKNLGFIAEDVSDIEVLKILARKISSRSFKVSHFVGKGCARLASKAPGWCKSLHSKGCGQVLLVHDLDRHKMNELRTKLLSALESVPQKQKAVVIPVEELEAWLLSDEAAIKRALNLDKAPKPWKNPERVESPKEKLRDTVWTLSKQKKQYVNTVHNPLIASQLDIAKLRDKCESFKDFEAFIVAAV